MHIQLGNLHHVFMPFPSWGKPLWISGEHGGFADIIETEIKHTNSLHPYINTSCIQDECSAIIGKLEKTNQVIYTNKQWWKSKWCTKKQILLHTVTRLGGLAYLPNYIHKSLDENRHYYDPVSHLSPLHHGEVPRSEMSRCKTWSSPSLQISINMSF